MKSFLREVADEILSGFNDLRQIEIIVPNRRTALFLKKEISENAGKTIWMPRITTIQEIFISNSDLHQAEDILLIYKLYEIFKFHTKTDETFDEFYYWGEMILSDFDDIDKYLVNAKELFSTIRDIKEIDKKFDGYDEEELNIIKRFWTNINQANISIHKEKFLSLWEKMYDIYIDFQKILIENKFAYQGLIYRTISENLYKCKFDKSTYLFIGFNALNKCEKALFSWIKQNKEAYFFWDADIYYLEDDYQEAGRFLRDNIKKYKPYKNIGIINKINVHEKNIEIITAPSPVSQVKIIPEILNHWKLQPDFIPEKTAIVLGDENLLIPLMYSIPPDMEPYNVSMGFPVKNSAASALVSHLISLQQNAQIVNSINKFYFKDVLSIINHSFIKINFPQESESIESKINKDRLIYIESDELNQNELFSLIFSRKYSQVNDLSEYLMKICFEFTTILVGREEFITELEFLNKINNRITILSESIKTGDIQISRNDIYFKLILNSIKNLSVAFQGEPLEGLQVLGFLETRCLDFDRIIMLSINEGIFPKNSSAQSLIPYNLRKFYELPSIEFQDSIFAYYFYRIMQRASDIKIIYSSQAGDTPSEASRFISQIKYELNKSKNLLKFRNDGYKINISTKPAIYAVKTKDVLIKINDHLNNGISPKAINEYLNCKFKYYLSYIEKIKEPDKVEEQEDGAFFGKLFHQIILNLYQPYENKALNENDFKNILNPDNIKSATLQSLREVFYLKSDFEVERYFNKIIVDIVLKYVQRLIEFDKKHLPITLIGLEKEKEFSLKIENVNIKIKGYIDRIDLHDGKYRVLDYKTGRTEIRIPEISALFDQDRDFKYNSVTQVILYSLMLTQNQDIEVCPGVLNINELSLDYDYRIILNKIKVDNFSDEIKKEFLEKLDIMFKEMLDEKNNLTQTDNINNCKFCPYNTICDKG